MDRPDYDRDILGKVKLQPGVQYYLPMPGGYLEVTASSDPDYPGVDIEFIADNVPDGERSKPRVIVGKPYDKENGKFAGLRYLAWTQSEQEDCIESGDFMF